MGYQQHSNYLIIKKKEKRKKIHDLAMEII